MLTRRQFLGGAGAGLAAAAILPAVPAPSSAADPAEAAAGPRKKMAVITTRWNYRSHAWHMAERFLHGYPLDGTWHRPAIDVVSAYVDQIRDDDLSRQRAKEFGFTVYPSIEEALRCGQDKLAVDAVLVIGEHGDYPLNEIGQKLYPRFEFFQKISEVFRRDGRTAPVFNDKHLSWNWEWAKQMVATARELDFPFLAGSSLPVTWRMPSIDLPYGAPLEEIVCVAFGNIDIYDFHALETIQCVAERRAGGETGVRAVRALRGDAVWKAMEAGSWDQGGLDPQLFASCLARSHTLAQPETFSHRYPTPAQMRAWVETPIAYRIEYRDGLRATMLLMNGLVSDFNLAARIPRQAEPWSTQFHLPPNPNVVYSTGLMRKAEEMFMSGRAPYPVERTLLTSGLVAAGMQSLAAGETRLETPHLEVRYQAPRASQFLQS
jgi:hypothetical protein